MDLQIDINDLISTLEENYLRAVSRNVQLETMVKTLQKKVNELTQDGDANGDSGQ